jgi:hypothetical protein
MVAGQTVVRLKRFLPALGLLLALCVLSSACGSGGGDKVEPGPDASLAGSGGGLFMFGGQDRADLDNAMVQGDNPQIFWADLEPQQGVYNWQPLDEAIAEAADAGKRVILRIYTNVDGIGQATPAWFFALPGADSYFPSTYAQSRGIKSPLPWDTVYQREFGAFLTDLGQRYDGNPAIEFVQTNAGGGQYGEMLLSTERMPAGWDEDLNLEAVEGWVDRWMAAFPRTHLSLMINHLGDLSENAAAYAADRGVYLQMNTPWLGPEAVKVLKANDKNTRIVLEIEDGGCRSATGAAFKGVTDKVFSYGFAIDYLLLCRETFQDASTAVGLQHVAARLRGDVSP